MALLLCRYRKAVLSTQLNWIHKELPAYNGPKEMLTSPGSFCVKAQTHMAFLAIPSHAALIVTFASRRFMQAIAKDADILVAAIGRAAFVPGSWIKPGAVVIDVGMNDVEVSLHSYPEFEHFGCAVIDAPFTHIEPWQILSLKKGTGGAASI